MVAPLLIGLLGGQRPPHGLSERLRAARVVVLEATRAQDGWPRPTGHPVTFGGAAISDAERREIEASLPAWAKPKAGERTFVNLDFRRIDPLAPHRFRVGVMPSTHPYTPPTYDTYVVALSPKRDVVVSRRSGRVLAKGLAAKALP